MIGLVRTNSKNKDFLNLTHSLDEDLFGRYGGLQVEYDEYNKIDFLDTVIIAYEDDKALGCGCFKFYNDDTVEIKRIFVNPESRKRGIARLIMNSLELWVLERGITKCILETGKKQIEAISLYEKVGYQLMENFGQYVDNPNSVCMIKILKK